MSGTGDRLGHRCCWTGVLIVGSLLVALTGCQSMGGTTSGGSGEGTATASAVRDPILRDLPKPAWFLLNLDRSMWYASGKYRLARCEYGGVLDRSRVKGFYEDYMPTAGFDLRESSLDRGVYMLRFESDAEVCKVRVREGDWRKTAVVVEIAPKPQGSPERDSKPPTRRPQ